MEAAGHVVYIRVMAFYRYRLHNVDGEDAGEIHLAVIVKAGEEIPLGSGRRLRVLSVVDLDDDSPYRGLLQVETID